ncbi:hypothetical protein AVEN_31997-1 [Araneus ventricosus]|uniref:Uncharacterized protein n=1 Tax=Araneus ventricosus TaxID=182803 RepID=A0A4Y2VPX9_ARAVE|nr:hypothetical protein AVEN_31997-1 [Araneus ventricosus]
MYVEVTGVREGDSTYWTFIRFLFGKCPSMLVQTTIRSAFFLTHNGRIGLLSSMSQAMFVQVTLRSAFFLIHMASTGLLSGISSSMCVLIPLHSAFLLTHIASKRLLTCTRSIKDKDLKEMCKEKQFPVLTFEKFPCHTQSVERCVELISEAVMNVCGETARNGYVCAKLQVRNELPTFNNKGQYYSNT